MNKYEKDFIREMIEDGTIYINPKYIKWRNKVYKRDGHACQFPKCKYPQGKLNAHHIHMKWYKPEWIYKLENGITLCEYHHKTIHKLGSKDYIELFETIALQNIETPKIRKKARKLSKKSTNRRLKDARARKKKRVLKIVKSKVRLVRTVKNVI
jgi:hypothetical protein